VPVAVQRRIDLKGCYNFRDLGGYPTADGRSLRWRTLFRSDALHHLTSRDATRVRDVLGVKVAIDLRTTAETDAYPASGVEGCRHLPLLEEMKRTEGPVVRVDRSPEATAARYVAMLQTGGGRMAQALRVLARVDSLPAVFFCAAGKDRTGLVAAVVLGLLGVPDDTIVEDYVLTSQSIGDVIARLRTSPVYGPGMDGVAPTEFDPAPATMQRVLDTVRAEYGSVRGYARSIGVDDTTLGHLRENLLD